MGTAGLEDATNKLVQNRHTQHTIFLIQMVQYISVGVLLQTVVGKFYSTISATKMIINNFKP